MRHYLVVAHETATSPALLERLRACMAEGDCEFHVVVPARHPYGLWSEGQVIAAAEERLAEAMAEYQRMGATVTGEVGDASPVLAVVDALLGRQFDEIILSTHSPGVSRWIGQDVPSRMARRVSIPVTHVVAESVSH